MSSSFCLSLSLNSFIKETKHPKRELWFPVSPGHHKGTQFSSFFLSGGMILLNHKQWTQKQWHSCSSLKLTWHSNFSQKHIIFFYSERSGITLINTVLEGTKMWKAWFLKQKHGLWELSHKAKCYLVDTWLGIGI